MQHMQPYMQPSLRVNRSEGEREAHVINGALQAASAAPLNDDVADLAPRFDARRVEWRGLPRFPGQQQVASVDPTALRQEIERPRLSAAGACWAKAPGAAMARPTAVGPVCGCESTIDGETSPVGGEPRYWGLRLAVRRFPSEGYVRSKGFFAAPVRWPKSATRYLFGPGNRLPRMMRRDDEPSKEEKRRA
jgi:hypothetical protein